MFKYGVHYDSDCTSAPMVARVKVRLIVAHKVEIYREMEHMDIHSAFLHEEYKYKNTFYIR